MDVAIKLRGSPAINDAQKLIESGNPSEALQKLQAELRTHPKDAGMLAMAGIAAWKAGPAETTREERMISIGRHLAQMGRMRAGDFGEFVTMLMRSQLSGMIDRFETCVAEDGTESEEWALDMNQHMEGMRVLMESPERLMPVDVTTSPGRDAAAATQEFLRSYGELLSVPRT